MDPKKPSYTTLGKVTNTALKNTKVIDTYGHIDLQLFIYLIGIVLYVISFIFLFQKKTEYLAWIFSFMINIIFPLIWVGDVMEYPFNSYKGYLLGCISIAIIFEFTALLMTIITNSIIQERIETYEKNKRIEKSGELEDSFPPNNTIYEKIVNNVSGTIAEIVSMNYWLSAYFNSSKNVSKNNKPQTSYHVADEIQKNNKINKILYTTTAVLMIGSITNYFLDQVDYEIDKGLPSRSNLGSNIHWWLNLIPKKLEQFGGIWQKIVNMIPIDPFIKFIFLFCAGFCFFMFSFFVRIFPNYQEINDPYLNSEGIKGYVLSTKFDVVNFPDIYNDDMGEINFQLLVSFFFGLMIFIIIPFIAMIFNLKSVVSFVLLENPSATSILAYLGWISLFIVPFLSGMSSPGGTGRNNPTTNNFLMAIIGFLFALLGTPVWFMIFEFFSRLINRPLLRYLKQGWENVSDEGIIGSIVKNLPFSGEKPYSYSFVMLLFIIFPFLGLWFGIMGAGIEQNWLADGGNGKIIKFIIIFIISMIIGWAFAFSSYFNILSMFLNMAIVPMKMVLFVLAPITVLALSITQIVLADKSHKVLGKMSDG